MTLKQETHSQKPLPPGDLGLPFIGTPPRLLDIDYMMQQYAKHGPVFKTRVLGRNIAVFMGPEADRFLLSTGAKHFSWRDGWPPMFKTLLGESLFVQDGDEARSMRRLIMPAFHRDALHHYLRTMDAYTQRYLASWAERDHIHWADENKALTFAIAGKLLMGIEPGPETERISRVFTDLTDGFISVPINWPWTRYGKALRARQKLLDHIEQAIIHREHNPSKDALSLLIQTRDEEGKALTRDELKNQSLLLLFAGHETTASMLTSLALRLTQHHEVWQRARDEQLALNIEGDLTMEHLGQMPYLEQVLKEVERLHPPVPFGFRGVVETFEFNGYTVPEGWTALYPINVTHRDPKVYTDPDAFDPDRFSPERHENRVPYSLVAFGGGPRVCIGFAFAQLEMKIVASHLLRGYDWELLPDQDLKQRYNPTTFPKDGLQVRFWRREDA